ncbi:MAG: hypothetical protein JWM12_3064, partial [Ilumatobacteraceae bacterium]|nr:hypothetical protein [Ilumatobacteraceae bacterium]
MHVSVVSPVFVGRQEELAAIAGAAERAVGGTAGFVLVGGEAGVGKTRLVEEVAIRAERQGLRVLLGRCVELGVEGLPFAPLMDAVRDLLRSTPADEVDQLLGPARRQLARLLPDLDPDGTEIGDHRESPGTPAQLLELVLGLLKRLSAARPLVLVIEDLHWADQSTLDLVAYLVRAVRGIPTLLVATYRSDELHRRHPLRGLLSGWERVRAVQRIELSRFDWTEVSAQLTGILGTSAATSLVDRVFERSEGNAFLVEEMLGVVQSGGDPDVIPGSLRDLLLARVDTLGDPARRLLRAASAAGQEVPERLLAAVAGLDGPPLFDALREVVEHHLLVVDQAGRGYAFRHALGRDAVYEDMLPGERTLVHTAYGEALSRDPALANDETAVAAALAYHWYAALDLPRALGASVEAARGAAAGFAPAEAQRHLERALQVWPRVHDARARTGIDHVELLQLAAEATLGAGAIDRAVSLVDQALAEVGEGPAVAERRAALLVRRMVALRALGRDTEGIAALQAALVELPADPPSATRGKVLASLANSYLRVADLRAVPDLAGQAVATAAAVGDRVTEADALISLGLAQAYTGESEAGLVNLRRGVQRATDLDVPWTVLRGMVNLSDVLEFLDRHEEAAETARGGVELATRVGLSRTLGAYLIGNLVEPLIRLGRGGEADVLAAAALGEGPEGVFAGTLLLLRAEIALRAGRYEDAAGFAADSRAVIGDMDDHQFTMPLAYVEAELARARGDLAGAGRVLHHALAGAEQKWGDRYSTPLVLLGLRVANEARVAAQDRRQAATAEEAEFVRRLIGFTEQLPVSG